jgi:hypothetical protein
VAPLRAPPRRRPRWLAAAAAALLLAAAALGGTLWIHGPSAAPGPLWAWLAAAQRALGAPGGPPQGQP